MSDPQYGSVVCGDAREVVLTWPPETVILTDPPYGIKLPTDYAARGRGNAAACNNYAPVHGDDQPYDPAFLIARFQRLALFGANHYAQRLPPTPSWVVWDKRDGTCVNDQADAELAWTNLGGPVRVFRHMWNGMLKDSERGERRVHPTQKPVALFAWLIDRYTKPGDIIGDPYAGGGACLVAAERAGRRWLACEIAPDYARVAQERVDAEKAQGKLL